MGTAQTDGYWRAIGAQAPLLSAAMVRISDKPRFQCFLETRDIEDPALESRLQEHPAIQLWGENYRPSVKTLVLLRPTAGHRSYVHSHHTDLVRERAPGAVASVRAIENSARALTEAVDAWTSEARAQVELLAPIDGRDGREIPGIDRIVTLANELRRITYGGVPAPLPLSAPITAATVIPEHDPDPEIREPARAAIRAQAREDERKAEARTGGRAA